MAAIVAGVVGAVTGFIASAHVASIPLSAAGLLLAILGIYFSVKRKRSGLLYPIIGVLVCAGAISLVVYTGLHGSHQGAEAAVPTVQELQERARASRIAQSKIQVQFVSSRPADHGKYALTFAYKCLVSGMSVTGLNGELRISDASGQEIETLVLFASFPQGLGTEPVKREDLWTIKPSTAQFLQGDASQVKVEFDPLQ